MQYKHMTSPCMVTYILQSLFVVTCGVWEVHSMLVKEGVVWQNGTARPKNEVSVTTSHSSGVNVSKIRSSRRKTLYKRPMATTYSFVSTNCLRKSPRTTVFTDIGAGERNNFATMSSSSILCAAGWREPSRPLN